MYESFMNYVIDKINNIIKNINLKKNYNKLN